MTAVGSAAAAEPSHLRCPPIGGPLVSVPFDASVSVKRRRRFRGSRTAACRQGPKNRGVGGVTACGVDRCDAHVRRGAAQIAERVGGDGQGSWTAVAGEMALRAQAAAATTGRHPKVGNSSPHRNDARACETPASEVSETGVRIERRAGLAPASPRRKRDVFPWTTNAQPTGRNSVDALKIDYSAFSHAGAVPSGTSGRPEAGRDSGPGTPPRRSGASGPTWTGHR